MDSVSNSQAGSSPVWDSVPFDVSCARCGHDLRGQTEPTCPGCALAFEWSEAVPIDRLTCGQCGYNLYGLSETRCPECGSDFQWSEALARHYRSRLPYFEYRWRDRLVRSFVGTWRRALLPLRFWRDINIYDPPHPRALLGMVFIASLVLLCVLVTGAVLLQVGWRVYAWYKWGLTSGAPVTLSGELSFAARYVILMLGNTRTWHTMMLYWLWLAMSFAALLLFQQSMRQCKVRSLQVMRVWAYAVCLSTPILVIAGFLAGPLIELLTGGGTSTTGTVITGGFLVLACHVVWSLRCAYRHYLRMPHSIGVALSSQVIAILGTIALMDVVFDLSPSNRIVYVVGRWLSLW